MTNETDPLDEVFSFIKQQRDELKLKMHLAKKDAQDEWDKLEAKFDKAQKLTEPLSGAVAEAAETAGEQTKNVASAAKEVAARELKEGYEKLRKLLE